MKLKSVTIENYRAIENLELPLDPTLTVLHGANGHGKTSVLSAISVGLRESLESFLDELSFDLSEEDWREGAASPR
ncbi:MAG: AAA family ATPase, partial [Gemmatimonadota bacterium]|nr:AAA family ATPase [Gemmatimonadota bacterium]